jgi:hypothetical protein
MQHLTFVVLEVCLATRGRAIHVGTCETSPMEVGNVRCPDPEQTRLQRSADGVQPKSGAFESALLWPKERARKPFHFASSLLCFALKLLTPVKVSVRVGITLNPQVVVDPARHVPRARMVKELVILNRNANRFATFRISKKPIIFSRQRLCFVA